MHRLLCLLGKRNMSVRLLYWMQGGLLRESCLYIHPSVCPSVKRVDCDKTKERYVRIFIPHERTFSLVFWEEEWLVGGDPFYLLGQADLVGAKSPIFSRSTTRFLMSLRWTSYVAPQPPKEGSKTQNGRFPSKIALNLKKVCYKVCLCENCQRQSCNAFTSPSIRAKMIGGGTSSSTWKFGRYWPIPLQNADFQSIFAHSDSAVTPSKKCN